nr:MAG TPA: hypothetical protein [Caudoviricetes sp.]
MFLAVAVFAVCFLIDSFFLFLLFTDFLRLCRF